MGKSVFDDMGLSDMSYLLEPGAESDSSMPEEIEESGSEDVTLLNIELLDTFKGHPFHVDTSSEDFQQLVDSVRENGILVPIFARPLDGGRYEIIAGHCRVAAAKECGMSEIPVVIRPLSDYEATLIMVHTNINGREKITISEKAKAYRMCMEAEKHQGVKGTDTAAKVGNGVDSKRQVYRYIRLSYLLDAYLDLLDNNKLPVTTGLELSYLDEESQKALQEYIDIMGNIPSTEQASHLREEYKKTGKSLSYEKIVAMLTDKPKVKVPSKVSFKTKDLAGFFSEGTAPEEMENVILKLLTKYHEGQFDNLLD